MLRIASYLKRSRHDIFYFRSVIPPDLRPAFNGKAEIKLSLRTSERKQAVMQSRIISGRVTALYMSLRDAMSRNPKVSDFSIDPNLTIKKIVLDNVDTGSGLKIGHIEADTEEEREFLMRLLQNTVAPTTLPATPSVSTPTPLPHGILSEVADEFIAKKTSSWSAGSLVQNKSTMKMFQEVMSIILKMKASDIRLDMIGLKQLEDFVSSIQKLPAERNAPNIRGKSIASLLAVKNPTWETVMESTVNSHIGRLEGFWSWAAWRGYVKSIEFRYLKLKVSDDEEGRQPFTPAQLEQLFDTHQYRMSADKPHRFWGPLIALYTGMRIREIVQLYVSDVRQENGVWIFDINANGPTKQTKNNNSKRHIPVHSKLIDLGFLKYRDEMDQAGYICLFPELPHGTPHGCGGILGGWFKKYRRSVGLKGRNTVFHSFRHTVADAMRAARLDEQIIAVIMGHKRPDAGFTAHYGKGHAVDWKKEAIESIAYPDLNLSGLAYSSGQFNAVIGKALTKRRSNQAHANAVAARAARAPKTPATRTIQTSKKPITK